MLKGTHHGLAFYNEAEVFEYNIFKNTNKVICS